MRAAHYGAYNVAPNTYTITATYAASVDERIIDVKEIGGVAATPLDQHTGQLQATPTTGTDATTSGATATLTKQPALVSGFTLSTQYGTPTSDAAGTGFTSDQNQTLTGIAFVAESKRVTATTGVAATFTSAANFAHISLVAVFDEAALIKYRKTLSRIGTRVGARQLQS